MLARDILHVAAFVVAALAWVYLVCFTRLSPGAVSNLSLTVPLLVVVGMAFREVLRDK